jgi:hypothetical protein
MRIDCLLVFRAGFPLVLALATIFRDECRPVIAPARRRMAFSQVVAAGSRSELQLANNLLTTPVQISSCWS